MPEWSTLGKPRIKELFKGTEKLWPGTVLAWNDNLQLVYNCPVLGLNRFSEDIFMMIGRKPNIYFKATWLFVTPSLIIVCIYSMYVYALQYNNNNNIVTFWYATNF